MSDPEEHTQGIEIKENIDEPQKDTKPFRKIDKNSPKPGEGPDEVNGESKEDVHYYQEHHPTAGERTVEEQQKK